MPKFITDIENRILEAPMKPIHRNELICISYLVFYSGIQRGEIGQLKIRDVIDQGGKVRNDVDIFNNHLRLTFEAKNAIQKYYDEMKRRLPTLVLRRKPLFPTYQSERTLGRNWKKDVNTTYTEIREMGMKSHFALSQIKSATHSGLYKEGSELFRITPREYQAIVHGKKIPSGIETHDSRCIDVFLSIYDEAGRINGKGTSAKNEAERILKEAQDTVDRMKNEKMRKIYNELMQNLHSDLSKSLPLQR